ncbi:hypothetical protein [Kitasatospora cathayae]|uniref:Aromatic ring-opening dioxygenase LigA n=1 Tax=Kitasatospora cathayae TaxID=3004092 RepID=A0ABY7QAE0_9ACTN|nr:hypothetical protein [Kitasatospora sp. HUAS 3-15]WBP89665.1 hypothetical protein O1G21_30000 [Kitasatospora sp. HUAS 3-15]
MRIDEGRVRAGAAWTAVAATGPYLTLKTLWLTGHPVGSGDPGEMDRLWLLNLLTFGMDAIAVALALAFVRPWGRRAPAGLVAFPMWVATGLLGTILLALPLYLLSVLLLGPERSTQQDNGNGLGGWVFPVVYGGFAVQGSALITAFVLYARQRWAALLRAKIGDLPHSPTLTAQRGLACVAALLGLGIAVARAYWAAGGTAGLPIALAQDRSRGVAVMDAVTAVMAVAASAGLLMLVFRIRPRRPLRAPLLVVWTAAGSLFGWGCWQLVAYGATAAETTGLMALVQATQVVSAVLMLAVGAVALVERAAAVRGAVVESPGWTRGAA